MTDAASTAPPAFPPREDDESLTLPIVAYVLYLLGFFTGGFTTLVGVVIAYVQRPMAGPRTAGHWVFLINTFWIALVTTGVAILLTLAGFPMLFAHGAGVIFFVASGLLSLAISIWFLVRCIVGLVRAAQGEAYAAPRGWML